MTQHLAAERQTKNQQGFTEEPLARGVSPTTEPSEQGARVLGEMTCPQLRTSTFSHTIGPDIACQHHYVNIFPLGHPLLYITTGMKSRGIQTHKCIRARVGDIPARGTCLHIKPSKNKMDDHLTKRKCQLLKL